jgi:hypothetical protein
MRIVRRYPSRSSPVKRNENTAEGAERNPDSHDVCVLENRMISHQRP